MERIKEIFTKLKAGHPLWVAGDIAYKERLEKAFEPFFIELESLGVARHFAEALLFFGKDFLDYEYPKPEKETHDLAAEVFESKVEDMTEKENKESALAEKNGAIAYTSVPMKGDKVGIKILLKKGQTFPEKKKLTSQDQGNLL